MILTQQRVIRIRKSKRGKLLLTTLLPITNRGQRESESKSKMGADMSAEMGAEAIIIDRAVIRIRKSKRGKLLLTTLLPITNRGQRESESKSKMGADMSAEMGAEAIIIDRASRGTIAILVAGITNE